MSGAALQLTDCSRACGADRLHITFGSVGVLVVVQYDFINFCCPVAVCIFDDRAAIEVLNRHVVVAVGKFTANGCEVGLLHGFTHSVLVSQISIHCINRRLD